MLSPRMRQFLDRLPSVLVAKAGPRAPGSESSPDVVSRLLEATLHFRVATMRYHSVSSARVKDYVVHPYRLAFAQGGLYLLAYVPEYKDVRTFAIDRIAAVSLEKQTFTPKERIGTEVFANSLGVNTGEPRRVEIEFEPRVAPYVRARVWHPSQQIRDDANGRIVLSLDVCHDWALRTWILGWGPSARVVSPRRWRRHPADLNAAARAVQLNAIMRRHPIGVRPRAIACLFFFFAVRRSSRSIRTGSGTATSAISSLLTTIAGTGTLFTIVFCDRGGVAALNLRTALASIGDAGRFSSRAGLEVALPGRRQVQTLARRGP
jgi:hypothetical protein